MLMFLLHPPFLPFVSLFFFTVFLYRWLILGNKTTEKNLPPSPPKLPIIGNFHQLGLHPHLSLQSLAQKYGPLMHLHFGSIPVLVVSSADGAKEIMKTHDLIFSSRPKSTTCDRLLYGSKDVAFSPYSEYWRQVKSICVLQLLSNKRVRSFRNVREEEVSLLIDKIRGSCSKVVNLSELFVSLTNDIVSRVAIGRKHSDNSTEGEAGGRTKFKDLFGELVALVGVYSLGDYISWLSWVDHIKGLRSRVEKLGKRIDSFMEVLIKDHRILDGRSTDGAASQDFVDSLLEIQKQNTNTGFAIDKDTIKAVTLDMFVAGTDTTSTLLKWTMAELLKNPNIMCKLQNEVREIGRGKSRITEDDLEKLSYLKAVVRETLRLHTLIPLLLPRESRQDVKVMGYDIIAGTQVLINAWAIARDPSLWDQPEEFRPDRFLNNPIDFKGHHFEFLPFGSGRRGCPGIQFAIVVNELALANVLHIFDFTLPGEEKMEDLDMAWVSGITIHKKSPLLVVPTPHS